VTISKRIAQDDPDSPSQFVRHYHLLLKNLQTQATKSGETKRTKSNDCKHLFEQKASKNTKSKINQTKNK
jgi:hypothetical protein